MITNETTFAIIKPDAVQDNIAGFIIYLIELNKFKILFLESFFLNK